MGIYTVICWWWMGVQRTPELIPIEWHYHGMGYELTHCDEWEALGDDFDWWYDEEEAFRELAGL
jgi:hypothetical protein